MKKITLIILQFCFVTLIVAQIHEFRLDGQILDSAYHNGKVVIQYKDGQFVNRKDSATASNGKFSLTANIPYVTRVTMWIYPSVIGTKKKWPLNVFFSLESCQATIKLRSSMDFDLNGSKCYEDQAELKKRSKIILSTVPKENITKELNKLNDSFILANPESYYSLLLLEEKSLNTQNYVALNQDFQNLPREFKESLVGKKIAKKIKDLKKVAIGQAAPNFRLRDLSGKFVKLSDYKGKYVFLHFWGSFCNPCRVENKNLTAAYALLKNQNIIFLGISVDESKASLVKAIQKDNISWAQLASFNGYNEKTALDYSINGVPSNFLINPKGLIIAKDLKGNELAQKIIDNIK